MLVTSLSLQWCGWMNIFKPGQLMASRPLLHLTPSNSEKHSTEEDVLLLTSHYKSSKIKRTNFIYDCPNMPDIFVSCCLRETFFTWWRYPLQHLLPELIAAATVWWKMKDLTFRNRNKTTTVCLTDGSDTERQLVPVHHVGMSISPDTPPSGAPW